MKRIIAEIILCVLIIAIIFWLMVQPANATSDDYHYQRIAGVLIGEGGEIGDDYEWLSCTVRNRLERGWTLKTILRQYHAPYTTPTQQHIDILKATLTANSDELSPKCNAAYFHYATWYADRWINPNVLPVVVAGGQNYYRYEDYQNLWQESSGK